MDLIRIERLLEAWGKPIFGGLVLCYGAVFIDGIRGRFLARNPLPTGERPGGYY